MNLTTVTRDCGHTDWADMLGAPCLECRMQEILEAGVAKIRAAAGLEPNPIRAEEET